MFVEEEYVTLTNTWCSTYGSRFDDLDSAKYNCSVDSSCAGIYDDYCDEDGNFFYLCEKGTFVDTSYDICVYNKKSK